LVKGKSGQIQTVEAITAAIILISVVAVVVESTSVTPLTSSFTNQHIKLELQNIGTDVLTALDETPVTPMAETSQLKFSVTHWLNNTNGGYDWYAWYEWNSTTHSPTFISLINLNASASTLNTPLMDTLSILLHKYGIAFNVELRYSDIDGSIINSKMVWNGDPSDNSVTVSRIIVLHDGDIVATNPIINDISPNSRLYNTVEVRLTMWVM
jgi:hypothetical protein